MSICFWSLNYPSANVFWSGSQGVTQEYGVEEKKVVRTVDLTQEELTNEQNPGACERERPPPPVWERITQS